MLVEDDPATMMLLKKIINRGGYETITATNGKLALEKFSEEPCEVIISDLSMPEMTGEQFLDELNKNNYTPLFIAISANNDIGTAIELMKKGIFDYLPKPVNEKEVLIKIKKAFETAELRRMKSALDKEHEIRMQKQVAWNSWKENVLNRDQDKFDKALFYNLRTTLSQGAGFGGLVTLIFYISENIQKENGKYFIEEEIMDLIRTNAEVAKKVLDIFNEIDLILNDPIPSERFSLLQVHTIIKMTIDELGEMTHYRKQTLTLSEPDIKYKDIYVEISEEYFRRILKEILINAMKFSLEESNIVILLSISSSDLNISFMNKPIPLADNLLGVPPEYERMIFEPFFRLVKTVDEQYKTLDFGLGLTFVDKVVRNFHGKISAGNVKYHNIADFTAAQETRVNVEMSFPIVD